MGFAKCTAYPPQQTIQWLTFLAKTMLLNDQTVFSVGMRLKKLPNLSPLIYRFLSPWTLSRLVMLMLFGLIGLNGSMVTLIALIMPIAWGLLDGLSVRGDRHLALRWYLYRVGARPWNYRRFLDYFASLETPSSQKHLPH